MQDTEEARAFLSKLIIEVVPDSAPELPVLLSYPDFGARSPDFTFDSTSFHVFEQRVTKLSSRYNPEIHEIAFEYGKEGKHILLNCDRALGTMLFVCMKRGLSDQEVNGTLKWAKKGYFSGEIRFLALVTSHSMSPH